MSKFALLTLILLSVTLISRTVAAEDMSINTVEDSVTNPANDSLASEVIAVTATEMESETPLYPMSQERKQRLIEYSRFKNIWRFVNFFIGIGILAVILFSGLSARLRNLAQIARARFFIMWLYVILVLVIDYLLNLPFSIYRSFVVESNYGFMNQTFMEWWGEDLLGLLILAVITIIPMWFFYRLVGCMKRWWLAFSIGSIPFLILLVVLVPVVIAPMFNEFEPVKDKELEIKLQTLASKAGIDGADVFQVNGSKQSTKINAYVTGMFGSKRIVLYDTMIDNFTHDEIMFVMGHEMGHYVKQHIWWGLALSVVFIMFALWLTDRVIHIVIGRFKQRFKFDRLADIASLPLVLIFMSIITFVFQPITNGASRYMEHTCDTYGIDITDIDGESAALAFDKLSVFNLSDPSPHPIIEFWFYDHPALDGRMAFVREYANKVRK
ncbi:MAG: M48 family metallopeptidase [candidate division Zixibacteria bacterium]|nr:M48 family metallopeptidase [candidate division Zixibacteria bacterium]